MCEESPDHISEKSENRDDLSSSRNLLERIAGDLVTADMDDYPALADVHGNFQKLHDNISTDYPEAATCLNDCADLIEKIIQHDITDIEMCQTYLTDAITAVQQVIRDGRLISEVQFPQIPKTENSSQGDTDGSTAANETASNESANQSGDGMNDDQHQLSPDDCILRLDESDNSLIGEFIAEAREHCASAEQMMMELESADGDSSHIDAIFRSFHTVKGAAAILNIKPLAVLAHESETLLDLARKDVLEITDNIADIIFDSIDKIGQLLDATEQCLADGQPFDATDIISDLIHRLKIICKNPEDSADSDPADRVGDILTDMGAAQKEDIEKALYNTKEQSTKAGTNLVNEGVVSARTVAKALRLQKKIRKGQPEKAGKPLKEMVKIDTNRLDSLVDTIGELVIAESMVGQDSEFLAMAPPRIAKNVAHLNKITRELQSMGMAMRLVPVRPTFQKLARAIRDLSRITGKKIELIMSGEDTEVDRGIVEKIGDPLLHMVRNAADHAIEDPDERKQAGKSDTGHIWLRAFHKGGNIYFEIKDDGRGLNKEGILNKARERGLLDGRKELSDREIYELILQPGFSTAKTVTDVSGRGVGMDVVKKNIDSMRGSLEIHSQFGEGTKFTIRLPLTLAIIDGMLVSVSGERYIIPTVSILESVQLSEDIIETIGGNKQIIHIRDKLFPLIHLSELFGLEPATDEREGIIVIVDDGLKKVGLVADKLLGMSQTVIKNLGSVFSETKWFSGGAILSDGNVGLIIDISGIIELAGKSQSTQRKVHHRLPVDTDLKDISSVSDFECDEPVANDAIGISDNSKIESNAVIKEEI